MALDIGSSHLGIGRDPDAVPSGRSVSLWVYSADCDALIARLRAAGVRVLEEPRDQPWGERVARVEDPDGIEVRVGTADRDVPGPEGAAGSSSGGSRSPPTEGRARRSQWLSCPP